MDSKTTFASLKQKVEVFRNDRDWLKFHNPKDLSMALSIEASELEELFLWKGQSEVSLVSKDKRQLGRVKEEMADICIYLLSLASVLKIDLSDAIVEKLAKNAAKYPVEKARGSNKKYTELEH
jgi:NTP pyrophosphatase (non-canonical NTP hydrolase)